MTDILTYYKTHSPITDPGPFAFLYDDLPDKPIELIKVINGILLHYRSAQRLKLQLSSVQRREQRLRTMEQRLAQINKLDPAPLTVPRELKELQIGWCREFAVFLVSMFPHCVPSLFNTGYQGASSPISDLIKPSQSLTISGRLSIGNSIHPQNTAHSVSMHKIIWFHLFHV